MKTLLLSLVLALFALPHVAQGTSAQLAPKSPTVDAE